MSSRSYPVSIIFAIGLVFLYVGERIVETGSSRALLTGIGAVVVLFTLGLRIMRSRATATRSRCSPRETATLSAVG